MWIQPFLCAAVLSRGFHWTLPVAAVAILALFCLREPLVAMGRRREISRARRWAVVWGLLALASGSLLLLRWPPRLWLAFTAFGLVGSCFALWITLRNRQRSVAFQIASAVALTSASCASALSSNAAVPVWCLQLWVLAAILASAGILTVHARLEARIAARQSSSRSSFYSSACIAQAALVLVGFFLLHGRQPWLAAACLLPAALHTAELISLRRPASLQTPLTRVGWRNVALSLFASVCLVGGFW